MALSNRERIDRGLHALKAGLAPFVEREVRAALDDGRLQPSFLQRYVEDPLLAERKLVEWDIAALLKFVWENWNDVFRKTLGHAERSLVSELRDVRNRWAHQEAFSYEDTHRALDSMERLLRAISADREARRIESMRQEVMRTMFAEQRRVEERRKGQLTLEGMPKAGLAPWRDVVMPHEDVAKGKYTVAEFAADLAQVARGSAGPEYGDPVEFFRRTYMTFGLTRLLERAVSRLLGREGDPVVELQTTFGGGKTHSMLALYHLAGHPNPADLPGVEAIFEKLGATEWLPVKRAVFVGTDFSPAQPHRHREGIEVRTIWGHLAAELLGAEGYAMVEASDRAGTAPGSGKLAELLTRASPCVLLIDEWVAFLRHLRGKSDLPAGGFETNLTFAQALCEAVKSVQGALLVATLPESDIEIGGEAGQEALRILQHTFGRIEASWRPATAEEGFEIVRRRLFEPITDKTHFARRDAVIRAYLKLYRENGALFPTEAGEQPYRERMERAYPIHPEFFERLNNDWGGLERFQRTRGLLRMMATVVHSLWEGGDRSLLIMPGFLPLDDQTVRSRLSDYLPQPWDAIIDADIDGGSALAARIDRDYPSLGRLAATRRVARAIFLASAPRAGTPNPGIEDRTIRLGTVQPGENPGVFGDALRRLAEQSSYLYVDGSRYWFSTQPNVRRTAEARANDLDRDSVREALLKRLRELEGRASRGIRVQIAPPDTADVPDEPELRLVLLPPEAVSQPKNGEKAREAAELLLTRRGDHLRRYRNMLLFVAPDARRLPEAEKAVRQWLAWRSIVDEREILNLDAFQERQARNEAINWEKAVAERLRRTWIWAMAPYQGEGEPPPLDWQVRELRGDGSIVDRAVRRFESDEALVRTLGPATFADAVDRWNLWRDQPHVAIARLIEDFASYLYLPRLASPDVLIEAVKAGVSRFTAEFAYAESVGEDGRYHGLVFGSQALVARSGLVVKLEAAKKQREAEEEAAEAAMAGGPPPGVEARTGPATPPRQPRAKRVFIATLDVPADQFVKRAGPIWEEVLAHLVADPKATARVVIQIEASHAEGFDERTRRIVQENASALKFTEATFEED